MGSLAIPPPVGQLFTEQPVNDGVDILTEVGARSRNLTIDAGFQFTLKEGVIVTLYGARLAPRHMLPDKSQRSPRLDALRVEAQMTQEA